MFHLFEEVNIWRVHHPSRSKQSVGGGNMGGGERLDRNKETVSVSHFLSPNVTLCFGNVSICHCINANSH